MDEAPLLMIALATTIILTIVILSLFWLSFSYLLLQPHIIQRRRIRRLRRVAREVNRLHDIIHHFLHHNAEVQHIIHVLVELDTGRHESDQNAETLPSVNGATPAEMDASSDARVARSLSGDTLVAQNESA